MVEHIAAAVRALGEHLHAGHIGAHEFVQFARANTRDAEQPAHAPVAVTLRLRRLDGGGFGDREQRAVFVVLRHIDEHKAAIFRRNGQCHAAVEKRGSVGKLADWRGSGGVQRLKRRVGRS